ncbi:MAG: TadE/TadG family type IV pilus assembly protein [Thermomicrobiales bacterium]
MGGRLKRLLASSARGQAIIEMALITPLLLMLMGGVIDFGLYMYKEVQAANCVREVARRASVRGDALPPAVSAGEFQKYCGEFVPTISPTGYKTAVAGTAVIATINAQHQWLIIGPLMSSLKLIPNFPSSPTIKAEAAMRLEGQQV